MTFLKENDGLDEQFGLFFFMSVVAHGLFFGAMIFFPSWLQPSLPPLISPMIIDLVAPLPESLPAVTVAPKPIPSTPKPVSPEEIQVPPSPAPKTPAAEKISIPVKKERSPVGSKKLVPAAIPVKRSLVSQRTRVSVEEIHKNKVASALSDIARRVEERQTSSSRDTARNIEADMQNSSRSMETAEGTRKAAFAAGRALDLYISQAAHRVQQHWAYAGQGRASEGAVVVFYISRSGRISGQPVLQQSSGNRLVDDSALRAILKSEPFPLVPDTITAEQVGIGLRFTDKGVDL